MSSSGRKVLCLAAFLASCWRAAPVLAQDPAYLSDLARLLQLEDRREFDAGALQRAARHPDSLVRQRAAISLGRIGDRAATPILLELLADRDTGVAVEAAFALGSLGDGAAVAELARTLERLPEGAGEDFGVELVSALCRIGGPEAESAIARFLDRRRPTAERRDAVTAAVLQETFRLSPGGEPARRLPDYIRLADGEWRRNAVYAAMRMRLFGATEVLLQVAGEDDALTRSYVARGLTAQAADSAGIPRAVLAAALRRLVTDRDAAVRVNALRSLATFTDSSLAGLAEPGLADRDPNVQIQAAATAGALGGSRAAGALEARLEGAGTYGLRRAVVTALALADPGRAVEAARAWRADPDWRHRALFVEVVATARLPGAAGVAADLLGDADPRVIAAALGGIERLTRPGDTLALARARALLDHADVGVRAAAIAMVGREHAPSSVAELVAAFRRAESDAENDARLAALGALGGVLEADPGRRVEIESRFFSSVARSPHHVVRRAAAARFGEATVRREWGGVLPVETGRGIEEYRDIARSYLLPGTRMPTATIETERGTIVLSLYAWDAPMTVDNFLRLADRRFYDNGRWHRVVPNFVAQDGDPRGDGGGGPGTTIRDEINRRRYGRGTLGMALAGPDTGGSQFFITHSPQPHLDGGYTVFGRVVSGWNALDQIVQGDRIRRIFR